MQKIKEYKLLLLLLFSAVYLSLDISYGINTYDEGVVFTGASQILNGEMPYSDFWTLYAPGQFFLNAITIKLFGYNLIHQRIFSILIQLGIVLFSYVIIKNNNEKSAIWGGLAVALVLGGFDLWGRNILTSIFLCIVSIHYFLNGIDRKENKYFIYGFLFLGLNLLFRHVLGGIFALLLLLFFLRYRKIFELKSKQFLQFILLLISPFLIYLLIAQPDIEVAYKLLVYNPLLVFGEYRRLEGPDFKTESFFVLSISILMIVYFALPSVLKISLYIDLFRKPKNWKKLLLLISIFSFNILAAVRKDLEHLMPSVIFSIFYIIYGNNYKYIRIIAVIILISLPIKNKLNDLNKYFNDSEKLEYTYGSIYLEKDYAEEYKVIMESLEGRTFYSSGAENDRIVANDVLIYYLLGATPDHYYLEMHPGITTEKEAQEQIISQLESTEAIVANKNEYIEPNKSSVSSNVKILDNYIKENYHLVKETRRYKILYRN